MVVGGREEINDLTDNPGVVRVPLEALDDEVAKLADRIAGFSPAVLKLGRDAFYAQQDTKTPVKIAIVSLIANLTFSLILMGPKRVSIVLRFRLSMVLENG